MNFVQRISSQCKICILLLIFSALAVSFLELWKVQPQTAWQADSEALVWGRISDAQRHGFFTNGGLLRDCSGEDSKQAWGLYAKNSMPDKIDFVYYRQSGLQGSLDALLAIAMQTVGVSNESIQNMVWRLNSTALVFVMLLICWWMFEEIGWAAALGGGSCLLLSSWITMTMANAYWVVWTMFLPIAITAFMGRSQSVYGCIKKRWYVVLFVCILIRFLCGYEFTSTVMLATEIPIFCYFLKDNNKKKKKQWIWIAFLIGVLELAAFAVSIGITVIQIMAWEQQGLMSAVSCIVDAVKYRTGAMVTQNDMQQYSEAISDSLSASRLSVVTEYITSGEVLWNTWSLWELCFLWLASAACSRLAGCISKRELIWQGFVLAFSMLPALSWYFLASGHAYIHKGIDDLLWMVPFVPLCVGVMFKNIVDTIQVMVNKRK